MYNKDVARFGLRNLPVIKIMLGKIESVGRREC
jgi:hypothetical protein